MKIIEKMKQGEYGFVAPDCVFHDNLVAGASWLKSRAQVSAKQNDQYPVRIVKEAGGFLVERTGLAAALAHLDRMRTDHPVVGFVG